MVYVETGRRNLLKGVTATLGLSAAGNVPPSGSGLAKLTPRPKPITATEIRARIACAQVLMREQGLAAILVEPGASMRYYTGIDWWRSERITCALIPVIGEISVITPSFEEPSVRESLAIEARVHTWLEDEDPIALIASAIPADAGAIGVEETVRFFIVDGMMRSRPQVSFRSASDVVRRCRLIKSPAELALMQYATDITIAAYRYTVPRVQIGMKPADVQAIMKGATERLGGKSEFEEVLVGKASALPHGSNEPQVVRPQDMVLMDCGCSVDGYQSDVSRTFVVGKPTNRQRTLWSQVQQGQQVAFHAAVVGKPAGAIDDAVRSYYEGLGYGPGYRLPGLSHRTGHGIGLDGHEPINLVRGEMGRLQPGMCFSNEPGLYVPDLFGVRIEDCFYMTEDGPRWFSTPPTSLDQPV
ncbi:M24 family metallopeptidase [Sphingomonas sp. M6A6_1c]